MNTISLRATLAALSTSVLAGCAADPRVLTGNEDVGSSADELAGRTVTEVAEPGVVVILFKDGDGNEGLCTGELVAPRVVLTAAHCTEPARSARVFVGTSLDALREQADVATILTHPAYRQVDDLTVGWSDIGAMVLQTPLSAAPVKIRRAPVDASLEGKPLKLVGFGAKVRNDGTTLGLKRSGYALVTKVFDKELYVAGGPAFATGCGGDSGGPAFALGAGGWELVAVESHGDAQCQVGTFKTRLDTHMAFVDQALALGR